MKHWAIYTRRKAEEDAEAIYSHIARDSVQAAGAFLDAIEEVASRLRETPEIGSLRYYYSPLLEGMRFFPLPGFDNYLLFYRILTKERTVEIIRIVHGARDFPSLFRKEK
jgi:toxin ParE1/3/4